MSLKLINKYTKGIYNLFVKLRKNFANNKAKKYIKSIIEYYDAQGGFGYDQYSLNIKRYHPMAEGKYLLALGKLSKASLHSIIDTDELIINSLARLNKYNISLQKEYKCWGLGFSYKAIEEKEPTIVTTAIITNSLIELYLQGKISKEDDLLQGALKWLDDFAYGITCNDNNEKIFIPYYSFSANEIVLNSISLWALVLYKSQIHNILISKHDVKSVARWIASKYITGIGWMDFEAGSKRIDLLHQCYILTSLREILGNEFEEDNCIDAINIFSSFGKFIDKFDAFDKKSAVLTFIKSKHVYLNKIGSYDIVKYAAEARAWSYGELLSFISIEMKRSKQYSRYWQVLANRILEILLKYIPKWISNNRPRDLMHILNGLVSYYVNIGDKNDEC
ncbi:hypothetical protein I862_07320 [endosymbiont of Acanthamoeba sp. UWC8]|uniref:hypothetical protein n=1 Tax=endosymbiont of Acanthamoeba sp. UWC8 TaxID=86106 RepID=UPI0004D10693|nr:hypothetical protein [endosymbiont of Acanthamoeba sp. UWC8]AIF82018.1 hypothetical protein I862_07320 [endosymbiont of Acanthamoeba sp. UWC8]